jgi:hypothetical protein
MPIEQRDEMPRRTHCRTPASWGTVDDAPPPEEPTNFLPGSGAKIEVMAARVDRRQQLFHQDDAESRPVDMMTAFVAMCALRDTRGVHRDGVRWRARPWWGYKRYHIAYFRDQADAVTAVRRWKELAKKIGPREAAADLAKRFRQAAAA